MLYGGTYTTRFTSEEDAKRNIELFTNWTPPEGFTFTGHWSRADGKGGVFVAEAANAEAILAATTPWMSRMDFDLSPLVEVAEAIPITMAVQAWQDSVG